MHIVYFFPVDTTISSGKNRATRQKIAALKKNNYIVEDFTLDRVRIFPKFLAHFILWFQVVLYIFRNRNFINFYVTRGSSPVATHFMCKIFNITTYREVHAEIIDEIPHLRKSKIEKFAIRALSFKSYFLDKYSDVRVFNNPRLKSHYLDRGLGKGSDRCVYNGASMEAVSKLTKQAARQKYSLSDDKKYLVFTGSASTWHGVHFLAKLQECFDEYEDGVQIICAGGAIEKTLDPNRALLNLSPLDESGCCEIVKAADACLLPVNDVRVSPGSPLKLYDYLVNGLPVISQKDVLGYSDEVKRFNAGILVNFKNPAETRGKIIDLLKNQKLLGIYSESAKNSIPFFLWEKRVSDWFSLDQG